jgi:hypothetical protein
MYIKYFMSLLLSLFVAACTIETEEKVGPENTWWLGGVDGGVFIKIQDDKVPNDKVFEGKIYFQEGDKIWYQGRFELHGSLAFEPENHKQYLVWDGEKLHLKESSYLEPLDPIPEM